MGRLLRRSCCQPWTRPNLPFSLHSLRLLLQSLESAFGKFPIPHSKPSLASESDCSATSAAMAPPPPELIVDVVSEILLRLPPDEPECLFRAALVCKPWLRAITDPAFLSRYRAFHGTPPLIGFIDMYETIDCSLRLFTTRAVSTFPLAWPGACCGLPMDCRHGRVLVNKDDEDRAWGSYFLVCDPVTRKGNRHRLPPPTITTNSMTGGCTASAVFCAVSGCKHLDCYGGPFCVVLMGFDISPYTNTISATFYSSEIGKWSVPAELVGPRDQASGYGAVIGEEIYFVLLSKTGIAKYDWGKNCLSLVNPPPSRVYSGGVTLMVMDDSSLGFAGIDHSNLYLWSRRVGSEGAAEWVQRRVIDLDTVMPMANLSDGADVVGFAEGVRVIFVSTLDELFMIELKSEKVRKVHEPDAFMSVLPYMGFYTPDCGRLFR